jgi:hypothetical protein
VIGGFSQGPAGASERAGGNSPAPQAHTQPSRDLGPASRAASRLCGARWGEQRCHTCHLEAGHAGAHECYQCGMPSIARRSTHA